MQEEEVIIKGERAFYLLEVLRLKKGEKVYLMDGEGAYFLAELIKAKKGRASFKILEKQWRERKPPFLEVGIPILKGNRTETAIRALSQMGVVSFQPFLSERTIVKMDERKKKQKQRRWQKQAMEEAELSQMPFYPFVREIGRFPDILEKFGDIPLIIAYEGATFREEKLLYPLPQRVAIITGPEGGFSDKEIEKAREKGAYLVSLGENILSAEFAPIVLASLILFSYRFDTPLRVS
ncbi:16S rRNA (uracil(1498)-N(3))-methyltransferase [bacterium]|nr:16S rRNA (uracil(1498)-N(3))-methyltransferase [bacterium]